MNIKNTINTIDYLSVKLYLLQDDLPSNDIKLLKIRRKIKMLKNYLIK